MVDAYVLKWFWQSNSAVLEEELPLRLGPPQIPRALASAVTGRRLTTRAISRP